MNKKKKKNYDRNTIGAVRGIIRTKEKICFIQLPTDNKFTILVAITWDVKMCLMHGKKIAIFYFFLLNIIKYFV